MVNYLYQGEASQLISMAKDYSRMIPNIDRLTETYQLDMMDELGIYKK